MRTTPIYIIVYEETTDCENNFFKRKLKNHATDFTFHVNAGLRYRTFKK